MSDSAVDPPTGSEGAAPALGSGSGPGSGQGARAGALRLVGGNTLALAVPQPSGAFRALSLEVDLTPISRGTPPPLHTRRGRVKRAELRLDEAALNRALGTRLDALCVLGPEIGVRLLYVQVHTASLDGMPGLFVLAQCAPERSADARKPDAKDAGEPLWLTVRVGLGVTGPLLGGTGGAACLGLSALETRLYGPSPVPAPLLGLLVMHTVGMALLCNRPIAPTLPGIEGGPAPAGLHLLWTYGLTEVRVDLLTDALLALLPRAGYRVPDAGTAPLCAVAVEDSVAGPLLSLRYDSSLGAASLSFSDLDDPKARRTGRGQRGEISEALLIGDRLLLIGDCAAALAAYEITHAETALTALRERVRGRRLGVLTATPQRADEARALAEALLASPGDAGLLAEAQLAQAALALQRGEASGAAALYRAIAGRDADRPEERACALLAAARCLVTSDAGTAGRLCSEADVLLKSRGPLARAAQDLRDSLSDRGEPRDESLSGAALLERGHAAYAREELDTAAYYYQRALSKGVDKAPTLLRLGELEHARGDAAAEERALAAAVEAGAGALAWPALCALFRAQHETNKLGTALLAWAGYETGELRRSLLLQAAPLCPPSLAERIDEELLSLGADDEAVRDRTHARLHEAVARGEEGARGRLLALLERDIAVSQGVRRRAAARELAEHAARLGDSPRAATAFSVLLEATAESSRSPLPREGLDGLTRGALALLSTVRRTGQDEAAPAIEALRRQLGSDPRLRAALAQLDKQLALLTESEAERPGRAALLRQAAELHELLGDLREAARRWLALCAAAASPPDESDRDALAHARRLLRALTRRGQAETALQLVEAEGKRPGGAAGLRVAQAELLASSGRTDEALGLLELVLLRAPDFGPARAQLGLLLEHAVAPGEIARSLDHLLFAATATDVEPREAGECALVAAELLIAHSELVPAPGRDGLGERAANRSPASGWIAVPASRPKTAPASRPDALRASAAARDPAALLERAATLLPGDTRPLEGLLLLHGARGQERAAIAVCDRLLAFPLEPAVRARILVEKGLALQRLAASVGETFEPADPETVYAEALACAPEFPPALRALRRLAAERGDLGRAAELAERERRALVAAGESAELAQLLCELGHLRELGGEPAAASAAYRQAGQLGAVAGWRRLARLCAAQGDFLGAADAAGRAAGLLPDGERGEVLLDAAAWAERAADVLRARDCLTQAVALGGPSGLLAAERLLALDGGRDPASRRRTLEGRLALLPPGGVERLEAERRLLLLCIELDDLAAAAVHAERVLLQAPADAIAATALAHAALRGGSIEQAAARLLSLSEIPAGYPRGAVLWAALGNARERAGDLEGAEAAYRRVLPDAAPDGTPAARAAHPDAPSLDAAAEALTALRTARKDAPGALAALRHRLTTAPTAATAEARASRVALRLRLADLARAASDGAQAREHVDRALEDAPDDPQALRTSLAIAQQAGDGPRTLTALARLATTAPSLAERAQWLDARAELLLQDGEHAAATAVTREVLALEPERAAALQRLVRLAVLRADRAAVLDAVSGLQSARVPLGPVQALAGVGLLLASPTARLDPRVEQQGQRLLTGLPAAALAAALAAIGVSGRADVTVLDRPLQAAIRGLSGDAAALGRALRQRLAERAEPGRDRLEPGTWRALARLGELRGARSPRLHWGALAFLGDDVAPARLATLGPLSVPLPPALEAQLAPSRELAPWLAALAFIVRGVPALPGPAPQPADPALALTEIAAEVGLEPSQIVLERADVLTPPTGPLRALEVAIPLGPGDAGEASEPAICDACLPVRVRLLASRAADPAVARYAVLRALYLWRAGVPLLAGRPADEIAALFRAAAALLVPGAVAKSAREREILGGWRALALAPERAPVQLGDAERSAGQEALRTCVAQLDERPGTLRPVIPQLMAVARRQAEVRALARLGDVRAALGALSRTDGGDPDRSARAAELAGRPLGLIVDAASLLYPDEPVS